VHYGCGPDLLVLALPRGGVPVAFEVAKALEAPLDVFLVRRLGVPNQPTLAMGAIASGGVCLLNDDIIALLKITDETIQEVTTVEGRELARRERLYRDTRPLPTITGRTVVLVDDGLATGVTMRVAARALRQFRPAAVVAAVPVASKKACTTVAREVEDVSCVLTPETFSTVGAWYRDFSPTSDEELRALLALSERRFQGKAREQGAGA
jgi:putative phosphoribosyl transferase